MSDAVAQLVQSGINLLLRGQLDQASDVFRSAIARAPHHAGALHCLGIVHLQRGEFSEAERYISRSVAVDTRNGAALANLGVALRYQGRGQESLDVFNRALECPPVSTETFYNRALTLLDLEFFEESLAAFDHVLNLDPNHAGAQQSRAVVLDRLGRYEDAVAAFEDVLRAAPDSQTHLFNFAHALYSLGRIEEAATHYRNLIALRPDHAEAHMGLAECLLVSGDAQEGWEHYEWRWALRSVVTGGAGGPMSFFDRSFAMPQWNGRDDLTGKTILLHAEQGFGDSLHFCRYVPEVARRGGRVILEVPPQLTRLLAHLEGVSAIYARGDTLPPADYHSGLLSLPRALGLARDKMPGAVPYLQPEADQVAYWAGRLKSEKRPLVGLVWYSIRGKVKEMNRSIPPQLLAPLADVEATFISLQLALRPEDKQVTFMRERLRSFEGELTDFADTAALIANLDLVITVDTAVAHLAGALGKPVWILLSAMPDWRWGLGIGTTDWYPTARLYRQSTRGAWEPVIAKVADALRLLPPPRRD